jgi:hypothetical protein
MKWKDFAGAEADTEIASHQQLSNFIWWYIGIQGKKLAEFPDFVEAMIKRFDNKILPFRPQRDPPDQIEELSSRGLLFPIGVMHHLIVVNTRPIGEILPPYHPIYHKIT